MKHEQRGWVIINIGHPNKKDDFISRGSLRRTKKQCIEDYTKETNLEWGYFKRIGFRCVKAVQTIKTEDK